MKLPVITKRWEAVGPNQLHASKNLRRISFDRGLTKTQRRSHEKASYDGINDVESHCHVRG